MLIQKINRVQFILRNKISCDRLLAVSIGLVYLWFGVLKFFPALSPAENLAKNTIDLLTFGLVPSKVSIMLLAFWESAVGIMLLFKVYSRIAIMAAIVHMVFTFTPLFLFPTQCFDNTPFQFTLLGQYILKNLIFIAALVTLYNKSLIKSKKGLEKKLGNYQNLKY